VTLEELTRHVPGFAGASHADRIRLFAWHVHTHQGKDVFQPADIKACFEMLSLAQPKGIGAFISAMVDRGEALKASGGGYRLERTLRDKLDRQYGKRAITVAVEKLLLELPAKIPTLAERVFLEETLICLRNQAFRAAIVMAWNLAYDHLCHLIFNKHLASFNTRLPIRYPKEELKAITKMDDFELIAESKMVEVCSSAGIISDGVNKVMKEKLTRRNLAAHPSSIAVSQSTAEDCITDLVNNVVLKL
jgi:hypothetical protein